jgi:hypothetical protein
MDYPEISQEELDLITNLCRDPGMKVFSQCTPIPNDPLIDAVSALKAAQMSVRLEELGFLKNITADHQEKINEQNERTGRTWTVFQITDIGRTMFGTRVSTAVN